MSDSFNRRKFLQSTGFIGLSVAATGLVGCNNDEEFSDSNPSVPLAPEATGADWKFPQSIASGDPRADSVILWTRVVPTSADNVQSSNAASVSIRLQVTAADNSAALDSNTALTGTLVLNDRINALVDHDHTVRQKVTGLNPATTYYYQFVAGTARSKVGRFKTAPAATATPTQLDFAVLTCQDWSINHWGVYEQLKTESLDFFIHLGDYIYETVGADFQTGVAESRHDGLTLPKGASLGEAAGKYANELTDYRYLYKKYRTDARIQAVHERFAMVAVWDDHEFSDDCWMASETYSDDNLMQGMRRRQANQAWYEFMPADIMFDNSAASAFNNVKLYRDLQFGTLAHLIMTDERLYRSDHVIPETALNPSTNQPLGRIGSRYMVPETSFNQLEQFKIAKAPSTDPLLYVSILGSEQREWWKSKMKSSTATWKLWGNEVSLLKMGIDGTNAIATLLALKSITQLYTNIANTLPLTGENAIVAATIVAAAAAGASNSVAGAAGVAIATAAATGGDVAAAATGAGLNAAQTQIAVATFNQVAAVATQGAAQDTQINVGAQTIAFGYIKPDVIANKAASSFVIAAGQAEALAPFFQKFLLNADQWDGYNAERKALMKHLKDNNIKNVVAFTGDIHSFFAGQVMDDYAAATPTPVMVDLVTAGVSSDSFFSYLKDAVGSLSENLSTLIYFPLTIPVAEGLSISIDVNLLNHTLGAAAPILLDSLVAGMAVNIRTALAAKGIPEVQLDATVRAVLLGLKSSPAVQNQLLPLAQQLANLNSNPWLKYVNTDAQGYSRVRVTATDIKCEFRQVNKLVGNNAPALDNIIANPTRVTIAANSTDLQVSISLPIILPPVDVDAGVDIPNCYGALSFC
jgi:alkaline phosphatase D